MSRAVPGYNPDVAAVEGWIVRTDSTIGYVKGCFQPAPGELHYYVPRRILGEKLGKLSYGEALLAARTVLGRDHGLVVTRLSRLCGKEVILANLRKSSVGSPYDAANSIRSCKAKVCRAAAELLDYLPGEGVGVTGSLAYDPSSSQDIDVVVYGYRNAYRAYHALLDLRLSGVTKPLLDIKPEWTDADSELHKALAARRVLQGVFKGYHYSVRLVSCALASTQIPITCSGKIQVLGVLKSLGPNYLTPTYYVIEAFEEARFLNARIQRLYLATYRIRYTEIPSGSVVQVYGELQLHDGLPMVVPDHGGYVKLLSLNRNANP
jgi:hypothetical protein